MNSNEPQRRAALKQMAAVFGLSLSAPAIQVLASDAAKKLNLFSDAQLALTGALADVIIPPTETPGALGAEVHYFLDQYLVECTAQTEQQNFLRGLARVDEICQKNYKKIFVQLKPNERINVVQQLSQGKNNFTASDQAFFHQLKRLVLFGYYTSEVGASQELAYLAVPGGYHGNVPFAKVGKAWALNF